MLDLCWGTWLLAGFAAVLLVRFLLFLKTYFFSFSVNLGKYGAKKGAWAVVTGASDGIGREYALQLAKRGFNVFLISRTQEKLVAVAKEIEQLGQVKTKVLAVDFASKDLSFYEKIKDEVAGLEVGILVNNVGLSYDYPENFLDTTNEHDDRLININIMSVNRMTKLLLPQMVTRRSGAVINVSSFSGVLPAPMLSVYSASKSYVQFFSECLATEYKPMGIDVQCIVPAFVATKMSKMRAGFSVPKPSSIVHSSLANLTGPTTFNPFWVHAIIQRVGELCPRVFYLNYVLKMHKDIRRRALAKKEREGQKKA